MNEFELIDRLKPLMPGNAATRLGAGDDCAVLDLGVPGRWILYKCDAVVEGVHFTSETQPERVGHKALARALSDVAAMAGRPISALVTLGLPRQFRPEWVEGIYQGMASLARRHNVSISGGETTTNPERIFLSIAVVGTVEQNRCVLRSGGKPGDALFVTGELGGSLAGKHLDFEPRLAEGEWLARHFPIHAMMDLSDGLAEDLRRLMEASQCGAELLASSIPISRAARHRALPGGKSPLDAALTDGEDFELLLALPSNQAVALQDAWKTAFPQLKLTCIGRLADQPGLTLRKGRHVQEMTAHGYIHFT